MQRSATPKARAPCFNRPIPSHFCASLKTLAFFADEVFHWDFHVVEGDLPGLLTHDGLELGDKREPRRFHIDHETRNAAMSRLRRIGDSHELAEVGLAGPSDEPLGTVDNIIIALPHRPGLHRGGIRARIRFSLHEAKFFFSAQNGIHETFLLVVVQCVQDRPDIRPEDSLAA